MYVTMLNACLSILRDVPWIVWPRLNELSGCHSIFCLEPPYYRTSFVYHATLVVRFVYLSGLPTTPNTLFSVWISKKDLWLTSLDYLKSCGFLCGSSPWWSVYIYSKITYSCVSMWLASRLASIGDALDMPADLGQQMSLHPCSLC